MTENAHDRVAAALAALRDSGGRRTLARQAVLQALANATHLSAAEVHERTVVAGTCVDLSTVHRVLSALVRAGAAHVVPIRGRLTYGLADHPHHHAVCGSCGDLRQLPPDLVDALIEMVKLTDFTVDRDGRDGGVVVYGRCGACR